MEEAQKLCDRMVIVQNGRIITDGSPQAIVGRTGIQHTTFTADVDETTLRGLEGCEGVRRVRRAGGAITEIGRASCRERVEIAGGDGSVKKRRKNSHEHTTR